MIERSPFSRRLWLIAGFVCIATGTIGNVVPLLPTVDFYALAAFCFARSSRRWESWLLNHPRIGPMVRDWRRNKAVPLPAKWLASLSMIASCAWAAWVMPAHIAWIPAFICSVVALYLWTRPSRCGVLASGRSDLTFAVTPPRSIGASEKHATTS